MISLYRMTNSVLRESTTRNDDSWPFNLSKIDLISTTAQEIVEYSLKIFEVMSNSSHDLRQKLEKNDFFKNISSNEFGQNLTGQSGSLFGIGDEKILSCNTNQKE